MLVRGTVSDDRANRDRDHDAYRDAGRIADRPLDPHAIAVGRSDVNPDRLTRAIRYRARLERRPTAERRNQILR